MAGKIYCSPENQAFYESRKLDESVPPDSIEVTAEERDLLLYSKNHEGKVFFAVDGKIVAQDPPPATLDEAKALKHVEINRAYTRDTSVLSEGYPSNEQKSWPVQVMEAESLLTNESNETPWIDASAHQRGIDRKELALKIKSMDRAYREKSGYLTGRRQFLMELINDADSNEKLENIVW